MRTVVLHDVHGAIHQSVFTGSQEDDHSSITCDLKEKSSMDLPYLNIKPNSHRTCVQFSNHSNVSETPETSLQSVPLAKNSCTQGDVANHHCGWCKYKSSQSTFGIDLALQRE